MPYTIEMVKRVGGIPYWANCERANGASVMILNGNLLDTEEFEVVIWKDEERNRVIGEIVQTFENAKSIQEYSSEEGLVHCERLTVLKDGILQLGPKWVFIPTSITQVVDYLIRNERLWQNAQISVTSVSPPKIDNYSTSGFPE